MIPSLIMFFAGQAADFHFHTKAAFFVVIHADSAVGSVKKNNSALYPFQSVPGFLLYGSLP